jgi:hypothetical protein
VKADTLLTLPERIVVGLAGAAGSLLFLNVQGVSLIAAASPREGAGAMCPFILLVLAMGAIAAVLAAGAIVGAGALWSISRSHFSAKK